MRIDHPLASSTSRLIVEQLTGEPLMASAVASDGKIEVLFDVPAMGGEKVRFEIDP
jgi:hypothetical protein